MAATAGPSLETIVEALGQTLDSFRVLLSQLSPEDWHRPTGCPGWDVQDVVSHVVGFEAGLINMSETPGADERGAASVVPGLKDDTHSAIAEHIRTRRDRTPAELIEEFDEVTSASMALRRASDRRADELTEGPFGWKLPYDRLLSIRTFDCVAHEQDVRRAVGRPGNLDGEAADIVETLLFEVLNGVMRDRVPALGEQRVRIDVTDRHARLVLGGTSQQGGTAVRSASAGGKAQRSSIEAQRRGSGQDDPGEGPEATIRMPFSELIALACGRADASLELVSIEGDEGLARAVLDQMGFTP